MKTLLQIMRLPAGAEDQYGQAHRVWLALSLTGLGCCVGVLALLFAATAYVNLASRIIFISYFRAPLILVLNLLPPVLLIWLFYFLSRRAWVGFLFSFLPVVGVAMVNYFKIRLRSDPLLAADLRLAAEAKGIVGDYALDLTWLVWFSVVCLAAGLLFAFFFMPHGLRGGWNRAFGTLSCLSLLAITFVSLFTSPRIYQKTANNRFINQWSDVEVFVSKGCIYPFLYSVRDMFPTPPKGYDREAAAAFLAQYPDTNIPEDKKVSVMGIMMEAFCDFTDFDTLANLEAVERVYAPWHQLETESVSGNLVTNIFAGGTVDSEWGFLTGYTTHDEFRKVTDSYVWYLRNQGYRTFGSHPGYGWFYNRQNVNQYLGFEDYWFTENHYASLVDPVSAVYNSDHVLADELLLQLEEEIPTSPCFSFSVSYQNHGPYEWGYTVGEELLTPANSGLGAETCNILNNYLRGIADTIDAMTGLAADLEALDQPVVLVLFGDHKPWGGNGNSVYTELGVNFDLSTVEGFFDYYSTPYVIWANSAAKQVLGSDFVGDGGDFSPCFLMPEVFDQCSWTGPGFMALSNQLRDITPVVHVWDLYWKDGTLANLLPEEDASFLSDFLSAQYYRENELVP
ncbi:MAG: LTA synthase family protein [Lawsonibacter sp.]|nr:LTA synthase family protein [Lawsonibacter sp.]